MVQRSPSQTLRLGSNSRAMTKHQLPFFNTSKDLHRVTTTTFGRPQQQPVVPGKGNNGVNEQEVTAVPQDVSKPIRVNFRASSLMSSLGEITQRVQRRE